MAVTMSELGVPLTKPDVMPVEKRCESMSSHPRVFPFFRTSDLRKMISGGRVSQLREAPDTQGFQRTKGGIVVLLVVRAPEKGTDDAGALDGPVRQPHGLHHGLVGVRREGDGVRRKGLVVFGILLEAGGRYVRTPVSLRIRVLILTDKTSYTNRMPLSSLVPSLVF